MNPKALPVFLLAQASAIVVLVVLALTNAIPWWIVGIIIMGELIAAAFYIRAARPKDQPTWQERVDADIN